MEIKKELAKRLTKEQIDLLKKSVKEKKEVPIRVVYTGEYWDKIAQDQKYQLAKRELTALKNSLSKLFKYIGSKKINIIHLGPGNGMEIPFILRSKSAAIIDTYVLVDVNKTMLEMSGQKIEKENNKLKVKKIERDIETYGIEDICREAKQNGAEINLIILIANGVLFSNDDLIEKIKNSLGEKDYFYITLELYEDGKDKEIIESYLIPSVLDLLSNGLKIIGYSPDYKDFSGEMDKKENLLKIYFTPKLNAAGRLLVLHSYKPNINSLKRRMKKFGFKELFLEEYNQVHSCGGLYN